MEDLEAIPKRFDQPDEITNSPKGKFEKITINNMMLGRAKYQPGWKWSEDVGPGIGKTFCDVEHVGMVVSESATASLPDGEIAVIKAGDIFYVPSRPNDNWMVGDEPYVSIHFLGANSYDK